MNCSNPTCVSTQLQKYNSEARFHEHLTFVPFHWYCLLKIAGNEKFLCGWPYSVSELEPGHRKDELMSKFAEMREHDPPLKRSSLNDKVGIGDVVVVVLAAGAGGM